MTPSPSSAAKARSDASVRHETALASINDGQNSKAREVKLDALCRREPVISEIVAKCDALVATVTELRRTNAELKETNARLEKELAESKRHLSPTPRR